MGKKTDKFRKNQENLIKLLGDLSQYMIVENLMKEPQNAVRAVGKLSGALKMYWAHSDKTLYPDMLKNNKTKTVAETFMKSCNPLKMDFDRYYAKWMMVKNIQSDNKGFLAETKKMIESLEKRFEVEANELFSVADKHAA
ncbi:MAG: hypothetical protein A4S09_13215 [Proteobacteria bacterium SG_bin7]|nr:MAG: hypothetical protein A4S09_13215 [Proteobacteria bacterium SG_bin7]